MVWMEIAPKRAWQPAVDQRLIAQDAGYEICDGVLAPLEPVDDLRALWLSKILTMIEAHAAPDHDVAYRMLIRTSATTDVAPDVSVWPRAPDPHTGGQQLAQLAFELVAPASLERAAHKAAALAGRGVRRVFAIDPERRRVLAWWPLPAAWRRLDGGAAIEDPALVAPLPIDALLTVYPEDALARALDIKRNLIAAAAARRATGVLAEVLRAPSAP